MHFAITDHYLLKHGIARRTGGKFLLKSEHRVHTFQAAPARAFGLCIEGRGASMPMASHQGKNLEA